MTELEAAIHLIDPVMALSAELDRQRRSGELTQAEYDEAWRALVNGAETGPRCIKCGAAALMGQTCAKCASLSYAMNAARDARPVLDLSRCSTPGLLITAVMATLERTGREKPAARFAERAEQAPGMNALVMIAREYVRLVNLLAVRDA